MIAVLILIVVLVAYCAWEYQKHQANIERIRVRILVNGTRGKSSVTRLIAGGLRAGGIRTLGKTTGTKPRLIYPDGSEFPILRVGRPNIIEQVKILRKAVSLEVEALVIECMAVLPENQLLMERQMVRSTVGVITNVRADHLDEMGPTVEDVARCLANTVPINAILFTAEQTFLPTLQEICENRKTQLHVDSGNRVSNDVMKGFSYVEHKDNVAIALSVCDHLGVSREVALKGMYEATPDPGVLRIFVIHHYEKEIRFVNAFAANDPDSCAIIWDILEPYRANADSVIVLVNCREDRMQRTEALAELIARRIEADRYILVGEFTVPLYNKALSLGLPTSKIVNFSGYTPPEIFEHIAYLSGSKSLVVGVGNIVGFGEELLVTFTSRGRELAY